MIKVFRNSLCWLTISATCWTPLYGQSADTFRYSDEAEPTVTAADETAPRYYLTSKAPKVKKPRLEGTGMMALGIVFTSIMGVATLISVVMYDSGKSYDCDSHKRLEDDSEYGKKLTNDREKMLPGQKEYVRDKQGILAVSVTGLALSIWAITLGIDKRQESREKLQPEVQIQFDREKSKSWSLVFQQAL